MASSDLSTNDGVNGAFLIALNTVFNGREPLCYVFYTIERRMLYLKNVLVVQFRQGDTKQQMEFTLSDPVTKDDIADMANHTYAWTLLLYQEENGNGRNSRPYIGRNNV